MSEVVLFKSYFNLPVKSYKNWVCVLVILFNSVFLPLVSIAQVVKTPAFINNASEAWADSVYETMTSDEKIGQLFMVEAFSNKDEVHKSQISDLIQNYHIGGLIFFQGGPVRQASLTNYYQQLSKLPLLIGIDGEWGLSMRLDSTMRFPRQMTLSAMPNDSLIYEMGKEIGRQCKAIGININFAPDIDINNNPFNPVINSRSFGENKYDVAEKGLLYMKGLQSQQILACGKHFPGHGNADADSHTTLPVIRQDKSTIDSIELFPFSVLINEGLGSIMVAHLLIPSLDSISGKASTLSRKIVTEILKRDLGFKGLVITDALNMKGVSAYTSQGILEVNAIQAGNDILLNTENVPLASLMIHFAIQNCEIDEEEFRRSIKKILQLKYWLDLNNWKPLNTAGVTEKLKSNEAEWLNYQLYQNSLTLLLNKKNILPLKNLDQVNIASLVINDSLNNIFQQTLDSYAPVVRFAVEKGADENTIKLAVDKVAKFACVIVSIHNTSTNATKNFNISPQVSQIIKMLNEKTNVILVVFGNAYVLSKIDQAERCIGLLLAYEDTHLPQFLAAQLIFGGIKPIGKLPVTPSGFFSRQDGLNYVNGKTRLKFTMPEENGIEAMAFNKIDSIAVKGIKEKAFPGCQILVASKGNVVYRKSFGYHFYDSTRQVSNSDLYDIASITKIASTALAAMSLYEKGEIDLDKKISKYLPELKKSNKRDLTLRDLLTHQAGLKAWIPFYEKTLKNGNPSYDLYHKEPDLNYRLRVADSIFIKNNYPDKIWEQVVQSEVKEKGTYVYSDLDLIIMQKIIEKQAGVSLAEYVSLHFYMPLGISRMTYNPRSKFSLDELIPTEFDTVFRHQLVHGDVHDPAAAMMGGVAGHAGLFADAGSLAVIMQMLLNGGTYGEKKLLKRETIELFTKRQFPLSDNRRGLIFDKPEYDVFKNGPTAKGASLRTYGHTGFTGTCVWADPDSELIFIFLSNRVNPTASNNKLAQMNIRTDMQQVVYDILNQIKK